MYDGTAYRFIGRNGSMGLRHGYVYNIVIDIVPTEPAQVIVEMQQNNFLEKRTVWRCPYANIAAFSRNWRKAYYA